MSGANHRSTFARPLPQQLTLKEKGESIFILSLHGYLFFGTANNLLERVRDRFRDNTLPPASIIVFDFRLVTGLDSSVSNSFSKLFQLVCENNAHLCYTDLLDEHLEQFEQSGLKQNKRCHFFDRLDYCMQWCEDLILEVDSFADKQKNQNLAAQISQIFLKEDQVESFMKYLSRIDVKAKEYIVRQNNQAASMYFIESGLMTVWLELPNDVRIRLMTMGTGSVLGEMGLYTSSPRTASAQAEEDCVLFELTRDNLNKMSYDDPVLANAVHHFIVTLLSERLALSNNKIQMLLQ